MTRESDRQLRPSEFVNCYDDTARAAAYARLEFANTYYLAFRDLPKILAEHVRGIRAVDFGCGTGRSTRFLKACGFQVTGIDIARPMITKARELDPSGDYHLVEDDDLSGLGPASFDLVLSAFTFDNIAGWERKVQIFGDLGRLLATDGRLVNIVSSPEIYTHEWASFSTKDYPENREAKTGDVVRIITTEISDQRPAEDILWRHEDYIKVYRQAGLDPITKYEPLATGNEPYPWKNEITIAPWVIYVVARNTINSISG